MVFAVSLHAPPGPGVFHSRAALGANPADPGQGSPGRTGMKGFPPSPGTKMGFELFEVHSDERDLEFPPQNPKD